ncbi:MAG: family 1 encapsulin nanocompartment shell protein [Chromatiaceae bacterium]|jgi:uncharacterized linocin/CFP29 family protein
MEHLNRESCSFSTELWDRIDAAAAKAARDVLTARRILEVDGPYGVGLTSVELGGEAYCRPVEEKLAGAVASRAIAVPMLQQTFELSIRRVEGHLRMGLPLDLRPVEDAAEAVARREEDLIYHGVDELGLPGLLTAPGRHVAACGDWSKVEQALTDVLAAVAQLDDSDFRGPYALALSPTRYNALFRRYEGSDMLQLDHLKRLCEGGVFKAAIEGGLLVDPRAGDLKVGQDLRVGYSANDGIHFKLFASESLVFLLTDAEAICTLEDA